MTSKALIEYCLKKAGAYLDYPFGPQLAAVRVGKTKEKKGRIFAQFFVLNGTDVVTFNCDVLSVQFFRGKISRCRAARLACAGRAAELCVYRCCFFS